jgi:hypothetical protein
VSDSAPKERILLRTDEFNRLCAAKQLFTARQIYERMGMSAAQLEKVRKHQRQPGPKFIHNALALLEVPYVVLFERVTEPTPDEQAVA